MSFYAQLVANDEGMTAFAAACAKGALPQLKSVDLYRIRAMQSW